MGANPIVGRDTSRTEIAGIAWDHPVYDQVFRSRTEETEFPQISGSLRFAREIRIPESPLLWFRSGEKACSVQPVGEGHLLVFSFPLSPVNEIFARDMLFVPTLYGLVVNLLPGQELAFTIGRERFATLPGQPPGCEATLTVTGEDSGLEFIPATSTTESHKLRISLSDHFTTAGHYLIKNGRETLAALSMNYDRQESHTGSFPAAELTREIEKYRLSNTRIIDDPGKRFSEVFNELQNGKRLWKYFLAAALFFLLSEALLIRFWK